MTAINYSICSDDKVDIAPERVDKMRENHFASAIVGEIDMQDDEQNNLDLTTPAGRKRAKAFMDFNIIHDTSFITQADKTAILLPQSMRKEVGQIQLAADSVLASNPLAYMTSDKLICMLRTNIDDIPRMRKMIEEVKQEIMRIFPGYTGELFEGTIIGDLVYDEPCISLEGIDKDFRIDLEGDFQKQIELGARQIGRTLSPQLGMFGLPIHANFTPKEKSHFA